MLNLIFFYAASCVSIFLNVRYRAVSIIQPVIIHETGYIPISVWKPCQWRATTNIQNILSRQVPTIVISVGSIDRPIPLRAAPEIS